MLGAGLGGAALALQFALIVRQIGTPWLAAWRFVGFFTILSNLLAAFVLFRAAMRRPCSPRLEFGCATAIVMVGLVYSLLLRATWSPQGAQKLADIALHDVAPVLFLLYFLTRPRPALSLSDALAALAFPLGYVVYARARGGRWLVRVLVPRSEPARRGTDGAERDRARRRLFRRRDGAAMAVQRAQPRDDARKCAFPFR